MARYFVTLAGNDNTGPRPFEAQTLEQVKAYAESRFGDGFRDDRITLAIQSDSGGYMILASKRIADHRWNDE